jgi:hypothetical protein
MENEFFATVGRMLFIKATLQLSATNKFNPNPINF